MNQISEEIGTGAPYRTLIVDDEKAARCNLRRMLMPFAEQIAVIDEAADGEEALEKIKALSPDLVFLDIHLPKLNAFQVIERLADPIPWIIFTTAYDKYAVKAFDVNSIDYLLKPIFPERLGQAIGKLLGSRRHDPSEFSIIQYALQEMQQLKVKKIQVRIDDAISFIKLSDICYFQGQNYLTGVYTFDHKKYLIETPLYELETRLPSPEFLRIHRRTIVNSGFIDVVTKARSGKLKIIMKQPPQTELLVSRLYVKVIRELFLRP